MSDYNSGKPDPKTPQGRTVKPASGGTAGGGSAFNFPTDQQQVNLPQSMTGGIPRDAGIHRMEGSLGEIARATDARGFSKTLKVGPNPLDDKERRSH